MEKFLEPAYKYQFSTEYVKSFFLIRVWIQTLNGKLCNLILLSKVNISKTLFCLSLGLKHQILHYTRYQACAGVGRIVENDQIYKISKHCLKYLCVQQTAEMIVA